MDIVAALVLIAIFLVWRKRRRRPVPDLSPIRVPTGAYRMEYADGAGEITHRAITVKAVEPGRETSYVIAHCHLRESERVFRADRILSLYGPDGARIADPVAHFGAVVEEPLRPSPEHEAIMRRARPGLEALLWIARADRELSEAEIETALDYVVSRSGLTASTSAEGLDRAAARVQIEASRPTFNSAAGGLARMTKRGPEYALVLEHARRMVGASEADDAPGAKRFKRLFSDHR